jgi:hypothetical protein
VGENWYASGAFGGCGLAGQRFEQPSGWGGAMIPIEEQLRETSYKFRVNKEAMLKHQKDKLPTG